jgi:DNA polymerase III subunit gamma/tau
MAYTVLARKYRSQTFDDVVGQDPVSRTLKNAIETGRVAHAYLFCGTRGVGKTTMARILAKALNCLSFPAPTTTPCCTCDSCKAINAGDDIDVIEIDGASNNRVDEIRELRENAIYRPARARYKIYIIDEVHMLSTAAFNALLKTLEEPPEHVKFIFATTEPNKVLATIQSRCQRFDFANINPRLIAEQLKSLLQKEDIAYEDDLVLSVAKMANGSMRDGLSLLDRLISTGARPLTAKLIEEYLGRPSEEKVQRLVEKIGDGDAAGTLMAAEALIGAGLGEAQVIDGLTEYMRDLLVITAAGADTELLVLTAAQKEKAVALAKKFDAAALVYSITAMEKLRWAIKNSDTPRALLDASLLRFALSEHFINVDELMARADGGPDSEVKKKLPVADRQGPGVGGQGSGIGDQGAACHGVAEGEAGRAEVPNKATACPSVSIGEGGDLAETWGRILKAAGQVLKPSTAMLLNGSTLTKIEGDVLTVEFPATAKAQKEMCESNGRSDQIAAVVGECIGRAIRIAFTLAAASPGAQPENKARATSQRRHEILNDPAVKIVVSGLDATITGIEEEPSQ